MSKKIVFDVPADARQSYCKACGKNIRWIKTVNGKWMPVNWDGESHFATCPGADDFRKEKTVRRLRDL